MPNRLANETSPYLLQHANNPVEWYAWGSEALEKSRREDKPIFLSIGYSACHWCHVMEHESFEDETIADYLNEHFVSIKVDREERPDLDHIYMQAVLALRNGQGGWPLSAFLTPKQELFFGGTYWPPRSRGGMPGFDHVLKMIHEAYVSKRGEVDQQSQQMTQLLNRVPEPEANEVSVELLDQAAQSLERSFDFTNGGFGTAPKFPHSMDLQLLLRLWSRASQNVETTASADRILEMVELNLRKMYQGGIYDHLAGGFARYSVDERWLVPHFEKMLYDNALLVDAYLDTFLVTGKQLLADVARETLDYILGYMTDDQGGFHSTEDADSEGVEGKFYVWTVEEVHQVLGKELGDRFCDVYDVSTIGNFEGENILNLHRPIEMTAKIKDWDLTELLGQLDEAKAKLLAVRDQRIRPGKDDKILVSWNALMIHSMARAADILDDQRYLQAASRAADFILAEMRREDGRLLRSWRHGTGKLDAYLDDYTYFINALLTLYETSFDLRWLKIATELASVVREKFSDHNAGGFYFTADDHEDLIARLKEYQDSSIPSGNSMAAMAFVRLGHLTGDASHTDVAKQVVESCGSLLSQSPAAFGQMLIVHDLLNRPVKQIVIADTDVESARNLLKPCRRQKFLPDVVFLMTDANAPDETNPMTADKAMIDGQPALYICEGFTCKQPIVGRENILPALSGIGYTAKT